MAPATNASANTTTNPTSATAASSVGVTKKSSKTVAGSKAERDETAAAAKGASKQVEPSSTSTTTTMVSTKAVQDSPVHSVGKGSKQVEEKVSATVHTAASAGSGQDSVGVESFTFGSVVAPVVESDERQVFHFGSHGKTAPAKVAAVAKAEKQKEHTNSSIADVSPLSTVSTGNAGKTATGALSVPPSTGAAIATKQTPAASAVTSKHTTEPTSTAAAVVSGAVAAPMIDRSAWPVPSSSRTVPIVVSSNTPSVPSPVTLSAGSINAAASTTTQLAENGPAAATGAGSVWGSKKSFLDVSYTIYFAYILLLYTYYSYYYYYILITTTTIRWCARMKRHDIQ